MSMGTSTNAMLLYGYHLGGNDGWELEGCGEYGELPSVPWYDPENEDGDVRELITDHLLRELAGFTETAWQVDGYWDRKREAEKRLGVDLAAHCSGEFPMLVLCAKQMVVRRGWVEAIDPAELASAPAREGWDAKLDAATAALGIRPKQQRPAWLLCSYWG